MTNIFITKQTLSNTTMNNTHDDYKSLDNKIIIKSIGGGGFFKTQFKVH